MADVTEIDEKRDAAAEPVRELMIELARREWRPAGTAIAVGLALLLMWHVVNGEHGLSVWQKKRGEDRALQQEIRDLQQENAEKQIEELKSNPDAIELKAREELHYARPGEVIYTLPEPAAAGK